MKRKNVIIPALVLAIALTGCSGKKVDYNMETENINTKAGSDISAFDDSTKWNDSFSVETSDKSVDVDISADITLPDCKSMSVVEVKNIKVGADFTRNMDIWETLDNYDDFMPYGSSSFIVTDQGVTEFTVSYPVDIVNESKNVELLSIDTIKEIIKDDMTKNSDQYDFTQNHTYNNLKLGYIRLKDASDKDKYTYVPAWCLSKQDKGYDRYPVYVNAIDGTIIRSDDLI